MATRLSSRELGRFPELENLVVQLLHNRGLTGREQVDSFLAGPNGETGNPRLLDGMARAVDRIELAIANRERVAVHGDFDADGLTATAVMVETLRALGAQVEPHIPVRDDGYGLAESGVRKLAARGATLVVTVDCGISSASEIDLASQLGMDVIVTDHHRLTGALPRAVAVINPRVPGSQYPYPDLAGVGVAFKTAQALLDSIPLPVGDDRTPQDIEQSLTDLVALGTVVDVVPLLGENRVLVSRGLSQLRTGLRPGLRELCKVSGFSHLSVGSWELAFALGPRLNAVGRLGDAVDGYRLLVSTDDTAALLAAQLDLKNRERQELTERLIARARASLPTNADQLDRLLLVASTEYPHGILGLIAARLVEEYARPAFVIGIDEMVGQARGSARSIADFDLAVALGECEDLLGRYGGHARAAGFAVAVENIAALHDRLLEIADVRLAEHVPGQVLQIDAELNLRGVSRRLFDEISRLAPFGHGNPEPLFVSRNLQVIDARVVGQSSPGHLKMTLYDGLHRWPAIGFGLGDLHGSIESMVDVAYHLDIDNWTGRPIMRLRLKGVRPSGANPDN